MPEGPRIGIFERDASSAAVVSVGPGRRPAEFIRVVAGQIPPLLLSMRSHVMAERVNEQNLLLRLGCLDTPMPDRAKAHIWRSYGATWFDPKDVAPEFAEGVVK
jgi:hypothetical protein